MEKNKQFIGEKELNEILYNETFDDDLNSTIKQLELFRCENVALDTHFFCIYQFLGIVSSISKDFFGSLKNLAEITLKTINFRKLIHRSGKNGSKV